MDNNKLTALAEKFIGGRATEAERQELHAWYDAAHDDQNADDEEEIVLTAAPETAESIGARILDRIRQKIAAEQAPVIPIRRRHPYRIAAAVAASILVIIAGLFTWLSPHHHASADNPLILAADIAAPARSTATLTLSGGQKIQLDHAAAGNLARQGNTDIIKGANGQLSYLAPAATRHQPETWNTLSVPRGSRPVQLQLADGSRVWLNTASSLTYPTAFTGANRKVRLNGEAYFEIARNASAPFSVDHAALSVQVLGTNFNINTYEDEKVERVTLIQGSVLVSRGAGRVTLRPGQQAACTPDQIALNTEPDLDETLAWKNGRFEFNNTDLPSTMRQIARWYDVDIQYPAREPSVHFMGGISRLENVSEVLKMLEQTKAVHFKIEGKKIIVTP